MWSFLVKPILYETHWESYFLQNEDICMVCINFGENSGFLAALHSIHPNSDPSSFLADKDKDKDIESDLVI